MSITILNYFLLFSRIAIALVFANSFFGKLTDLRSVEETIGKFDLFSRRFSRPAVWLLRRSVRLEKCLHAARMMGTGIDCIGRDRFCGCLHSSRDSSPLRGSE